MSDVIGTSRKKIKLIVLAVFAITVLFLGQFLIEDVAADKIIINQVPVTGRLEFWTEPGLYLQKAGLTVEYDKAFQVWFSHREDEGTEANDQVKIVFNDAGTGFVSGSGRVVMPRDEVHLRRIREDYSSMAVLTHELIYPTIRKVIFASGPLMSSFESYAAKKNDLIRYIEDQLEYGVYKTETKDTVMIDPLTQEQKSTTIARLVEDPKHPGGFARQEESPFAYYGITVKPITVNDIAYEDKIVKQIDQQQKAYMAVQTARAEALKAKQEAIKAEEQGKANAATAKWEQEVIKAKEVTLAQQNFEVAELAAKEALETKKKIVAEGQAEAEAARLKVAAGLTPQEAAEWKYKTAVGVAEKLSGLNFPKLMIFGSGNNSPMDPFQAVGLESFMKITNGLSKD